MTDLPCISFEEYFQIRKRIIIDSIGWHKKNPVYKRVAENLEKLLLNLPDELGIMEKLSSWPGGIDEIDSCGGY